MASVREGAQAPDLPRTSDELGREIERMQAELDRATQLGGLRNDPTLPLIRALSASLGLQWRLHDQAVGYFHSASTGWTASSRTRSRKANRRSKRGGWPLSRNWRRCWRT